MGYRSRSWKQQQKQQQAGQELYSESREFIPAPTGGVDRSIDLPSLPLNKSQTSSFVPTEIGLIAVRNGKERILVKDDVDTALTYIPFEGSASASSKLFVHTLNGIYNVAANISAAALTTTTASISVSVSIPASKLDYLEVNNRLIMTHGGTSAPPITYSNASAFKSWSATASGDSIVNMWGINLFKNRVYTWSKLNLKFYYGGVDAVQGTLDPFDLTYVAGRGAHHIVSMRGMTRDGGSGPDDFAVFILDDGQVVIYQGSNPGDASNWSLVGVYKIGRPIGRRCAVDFGGQLAVLCKDDVYFMPEDLQFKRQPSPVTKDRTVLPTSGEIDGFFWQNRGWLVWDDGTIINTRMRGLPAADVSPNGIRPMANFKDRIFYNKLQGGTDYNIVTEFHPIDADGMTGNLVTAVIPLKGRSNISLVNPILQFAAGSGTCVYKVGVNYDFMASASAADPIFTTASATADSTGLWSPGYGTGARPRIHLNIISASCDASSELVLRGFDITFSDTGGI